MGGKTRIPGAIPDFDQFISTTNKYLQDVDPDSNQPNWQRMGLEQEEADEWNERSGYWRDDLHKKHSNPEFKTKTINKMVRTFMKNFRGFANPLLNRMAVHDKATTTDEAVFRFVRRRKKPSHRRMQILEKCFAYLHQLGGGEIKCRFRTEHGTGRPKLPEGADSVQYAYKIGDTAPHDPNDQMQIGMATKASFILNLGDENHGKYLHIYVRWYNARKPELSGPWSILYTLLIL